MLKLIFKNLLSRKGKNIWLFLELVIVTIVAWATIDAVVVHNYIKNVPLGYDLSSFVELTIDAEGLTQDGNLDDEGIEKLDAALHRIVSNLKGCPEVYGAVRYSSSWLESASFSSMTLNKDSLTGYGFFVYNFYPGWDVFSLLDMESVGKSPSTSDLVNQPSDDEHVIISESAARLLFGTSDATGLTIPNLKNPNKCKEVIGVVTDLRHHSPESDAVSLYTIHPYLKFDYFPYILIRLKDGQSAQEFVNKRYEAIEQMLPEGMELNLLQTLESKSSDYLYVEGYTNSMRLRYALLLFFLVNIGLGMTGTFLLQTRKRTEEAGIMLSFGATKGYILRMLLGEGFVLTTSAWLAGCFIFYHIAKIIGLTMGLGDVNVDSRVGLSWISDFNTHFAIVSLIVYAVLLIVVMLGIWIPARKISSVNPVDALRDE